MSERTYSKDDMNKLAELVGNAVRMFTGDVDFDEDGAKYLLDELLEFRDIGYARFARDALKRRYRIETSGEFQEKTIIRAVINPERFRG